MATWEVSTPKLEAAINSSVNESNSTVIITFEDVNKKKLGVLFSLPVVPATICLLAARMNELIGHIPYEDRPELQTLECMNLDWAMNDAGAIALSIGLQGGGFLPIQCDRATLTTLKTKLEEALEASDPAKRH